MFRPDSGTATPGLTAPTQRGFSSRLIGDVVVDLGFATREEVEAAVDVARRTYRTTGRVLREEGTVTADQLSRAVAERHGLDHVDLVRFKVDHEVARLIPAAAARRYAAMPIAQIDADTILVAMAEPSNVRGIDDIALLAGMRVQPAIASEEDIHLLISRLGGNGAAVDDVVPEEQGDAASDDSEELGEAQAEAPIVRLVHSIIHEAIERGASDIHFAPHNGDLRCHFRIDGVLVPTTTVPRKMMPAVVSRLKIMGQLDIAERRAPQDGRMSVTVDGHPVDIRLVTLPLVGGETVVLRILDRREGALGLAELGMPARERARFEDAFHRSHGAILVTGPTGSGKTTTLYSALAQLNTGDHSIITIEDPVEYRMDGVKQMQVNPKAGLTFATGLRSMMRADPDIVMVGEIRDRDTATIAVEAALTGHLVLSTLHSNDVASTPARLVEMGIEPFLVGTAIQCIVSQRLARRLCPDCKRPVLLDAHILRSSGFDADAGISAFEPHGCGRCAGTGYRGRTGLYEVMRMTEEVRAAILRREPASVIAAAARADGTRSLREAGLDKVREGITSLAEVARVTGTL